MNQKDVSSLELLESNIMRTENEKNAQTHQRPSPHCKFARQMEGNICREDTEGATAACWIETGSRSRKRIEIRNREQEDSLPVPNLGPIDKSVERISAIETEPEQVFPLHPIHAIYKMKPERLNTFRIWKFGDIVQPQMLVDAGFFYTGNGDCVQCFYCGGRLCSWKKDEMPWVEHARWFPTCQFVLQYKGQHFVNMCEAAGSEADNYDQPVANHDSSMDSDDLNNLMTYHQKHEPHKSKTAVIDLDKSEERDSIAKQIHVTFKDLGDAGRTTALNHEIDQQTQSMPNSQNKREFNQSHRASKPENTKNWKAKNDTNQDRILEYDEIQAVDDSELRTTIENTFTEKNSAICGLYSCIVPGWNITAPMRLLYHRWSMNIQGYFRGEDD